MDTRVFMYRKGESKLFDSPAEVPHGESWQDTPVPDDAPEPAPVITPEEPTPEAKSELDALREQASALGVKVDMRWSVKRLKAIIDAETAPE